MAKKSLVTGGAGFIGSHLVDKLIDRGDEVTVIDNLSTGKKSNLNPKISRFFNFDLRENLTHLNLECDVIYHLAALPRIQPSFINPAATLSSNCLGTVNILEVARKYKSKVVYAGSSSFYFGVYANPYAHSKWIGEEHCKLYNTVYGLSVGIARFFNVYGPRQIKDHEFSTLISIFERQKAAGEPLTIFGDGSKRRDFTSVFDVVSGLIAIGEKEWNGDVFNLGRSNNYSILGVANMFQPKAIIHLPDRKGEADVTLADISSSQEKLGWSPKENLPDYVADFLRTLK